MFDTKLIASIYNLAKETYASEKNPLVKKLADKVFGIVETNFDNMGLDLATGKEIDRTPKFYINAKKSSMVYFNGSKEYVAKCLNGDKFETYVGASLCLGYSEFGSKGKYHKELEKFTKEYLTGLELPYEQISLMYQCNKHNGKANFVAYVDNLFIGNTYEELMAKYAKANSNTETEIETEIRD